MSNQTKVKEFFEGRRRRAKLVLYTHLKTKAEESRFKLSLSLPLFPEQPLVSMPKAVSDVFTVMAKDDSDMVNAALSIFLEGMTFEVFTADTGGQPVLSITGARFTKLKLVAAGVAEKKTIDLEMVAYVPATLQVHDWVFPQLHGDFFLEAVYSQSEMSFSDDDDESDEDEAPAEKPVKPTTPKKSGPKDLDQFHQQELLSASKPN